MLADERILKWNPKDSESSKDISGGSRGAREDAEGRGEGSIWRKHEEFCWISFLISNVNASKHILLDS